MSDYLGQGNFTIRYIAQVCGQSTSIELLLLCEYFVQERLANNLKSCKEGEHRGESRTLKKSMEPV